MPTRRQFLAFSPLLLGAFSCRDPLSGAPKATTLPLNTAWGTDPLWNDGAAEIARYDASLNAGGDRRSFTATFITQKESYNLEKLAKADRPAKAKKLADAIKLSIAFDAPAPSGADARTLASVEIRADSPGRLLRQTVSTQELAGSVYKEFARHGGSGRYLWRSPWEADGSGERPVPLDAAHLTEEQLFLLVRALDFKPGLKFAAAVYPPQLGDRAPAPEPQALKFLVADGPDFELAGKPLKTWRIEGLSSSRKDAPRRLLYHVAKEFPHTLLSFESSDGRSLRLSALERARPDAIKR